MTVMSLYEQGMREIDRLEKYHEGCELGDALGSILNAARSLLGINHVHEAHQLIAIARGLTADSLAWKVDEDEELTPVEKELHEYLK